jgi:hypothetical protein
VDRCSYWTLGPGEYLWYHHKPYVDCSNSTLTTLVLELLASSTRAPCLPISLRGRAEQRLLDDTREAIIFDKIEETHQWLLVSTKMVAPHEAGCTQRCVDQGICREWGSRRWCGELGMSAAAMEPVGDGCCARTTSIQN